VPMAIGMGWERTNRKTLRLNSVRNDRSLGI